MRVRMFSSSGLGHHFSTSGLGHHFSSSGLGHHFSSSGLGHHFSSSRLRLFTIELLIPNIISNDHTTCSLALSMETQKRRACCL